MLDIKLIRERPEEVRANLARRHDEAVLERLALAMRADAAWREALQRERAAREELNALGQEIGRLKKAKQDASAVQARGAEIRQAVDQASRDVAAALAERDAALKRLPNLLHESVPHGKDDSENVTVRAWGEPREATGARPHGEFAEDVGWADFGRSAKISGAGFAFVMGDLALLELAIQRFAIDSLVAKGFTLVQPPYMMRREPYEGVTDLGDFETVMYKIEGEDEYLIATSEHPMAGMFMGEILPDEAMPIQLVGVSPCFRKEIGASGVDTRGLFRLHQFHKVEQFVWCKPEDSWEWHERIIRNAEEIFQAFELPYRVVNICTGDIGTVAAKKYDIEAWSPRAGKYREVVSGSNCTDYQARRLGVRMGKAGSQEDKRVPHTLNSTAVATSRALVMFLENHSQPDGRLFVPKALRPYVGGREFLEPGKRVVP